jgi:hypothetical protein
MIYKRLLYPIVLVVLLLVSLAGCAASQPTPDRVATGVAEAKAIAATLTAEIPTATLTPLATAMPIIIVVTAIS